MQVNPNARFVETNKADEFTGEIGNYYKSVVEAGGTAIQKFSFIGHGYLDQLVLNFDDPKELKEETKIHRYPTIQSIADKGIQVRSFHFAACDTAQDVSKGMNIAEYTAKAFNAYAEGQK